MFPLFTSEKNYNVLKNKSKVVGEGKRWKNSGTGEIPIKLMSNMG